jgi:hypothetical protein
MFQKITMKQESSKIDLKQYNKKKKTNTQIKTKQKTKKKKQAPLFFRNITVQYPFLLLLLLLEKKNVIILKTKFLSIHKSMISNVCFFFSNIF